MGWAKKIQAKIVSIFYPIQKEKLTDWTFINDENGPFGPFLSHKKWQSNLDGIPGHRFILYPCNNRWKGCSEWNLIDYSTDKIHKIYNALQLKELIPNNYF